MNLRLIAQTQKSPVQKTINEKISIKHKIHDPKIYYLNALRGRKLAVNLTRWSRVLRDTAASQLNDISRSAGAFAQLGSGYS